MSRALSAVIVVLALIDGLVHLTLDLVLFHGHFFANSLSTLFLLDFLGFLVLIAAFLLSSRGAAFQRRAVNVVMIVYVAVELFEWLSRHDPNPHGWGYPTKALEVILIIALVVHAFTLGEAKAYRAAETST